MLYMYSPAKRGAHGLRPGTYIYVWQHILAFGSMGDSRLDSDDDFGLDLASEPDWQKRSPSARSSRAVGSRYPPCSVVWTPIPGCSWFFPMIGHMGLTDEDGTIYEFLGMGVTKNDGLAFGPVTRYVPLPKKWGQDWNMGVLHGCRLSEGRMHMGCVNNCHTFVADSLNHMKYLRFSYWNSIVLALMVFFAGRYPSVGLFLYHWIPPAITFTVFYFLAGGRV
eukprot:GEMP01093431.1.p1 GENE.GEMP01093431.1~~GEMP01093431.1.p1  ORF type:complete len:222 (+),score=28.32 GEMP01093431.1:164-829(+)